ncbi:MAG TPA: hypothetical protein VF142_16605 [Longimicrobium sp.]
MSRLKMAATLAVIGGLAAGVHQTVSAATADAQQTVSAPAEAREDGRKNTLSVTVSGPNPAARNVDCHYTANVSGGTPPYYYSWIGTGLIDGWSDPTATYRWSTIGNKALRVDVEDSLGATGYADVGISVSSTGSC